MKKSAKIERMSAKLHIEDKWGTIGFYSICVDSKVASSTIKQKFEVNKPILHLSVLRERDSEEGSLCWMEGGKSGFAARIRSSSPLADFVYMQLQDSLYCLSARRRDSQSIGENLNNYIHWGTGK